MIQKKIWITGLLLACCLAGSNLSAQTFEEWKKQRQQEMQQFKEERQQQIQRLADEFNQYVEQRDREYADYLKERWRQFEVFQGLEPPDEPKPDEAPVFEEPERPEPPAPLPVIPPALEEIPAVIPTPVMPRVTKTEPEKFPKNTAEIDFYGFPVVFDYDKKMKEKLAAEVNEDAISKYFETLSNTGYNQLLEQLFDYSDQMSLNDWGYYMLLKNVAGNIAGMSNNTSEMLTWFLLIRSGYKAKAAFYENDVFVLLPISNQVYGKNFFTFDNVKYYMMEGDLLNVFTYENDFPDAQKALDLNLYEAIALGDASSSKKYDFVYQDQAHPVDISYNSNAISFYKDYPLADIKVYFDAAVSPEAKFSLANNFIPLVQGKTPAEAADLLLHFVQTAFDYKTDQEQFGYEKFFFAEEVFYYPYCDCEDRSVLLAYLVKSLLGLEVIGLNYPGHMATAICFEDDVPGDYINWQGKKYVVADPTYIGAPLGLTMPRYADETARVILVENTYAQGKQKDKIWSSVMAAGGQRGDNRHDLILTPDGGSLVTGYFTGDFSYGDIMIRGDENHRMFTLKLDKDMGVQWYGSSSGNGKSVAFGLAVNPNGDVLVTGTFQGKISLGGFNLASAAMDIFVACYQGQGDLKWARQAHIDTANQNNFLNFVSRFTADGTHLGNDLYFETGDFDNYGLSVTPEGEVIVAGAFNKTTGMNVMELSMNELENFDVSSALKEENDRLIRESYEKTIAGLFAVVHLVNSSGMSIPGEEAQKVLDEYNPGFKNEFPEIYKTIKDIQFIKNQDGIVTIRTEGRSGVSIDMMRVDNNARIKIVMLESGDTRIDVLSGIRVGKAFWWYDLNYLVMYRLDGNLLFDYDTDHSQQVRNLRDDILY